jgi:hypothetical protein
VCCSERRQSEEAMERSRGVMSSIGRINALTL